MTIQFPIDAFGRNQKPTDAGKPESIFNTSIDPPRDVNDNLFRDLQNRNYSHLSRNVNQTFTNPDGSEVVIRDNKVAEFSVNVSNSKEELIQYHYSALRRIHPDIPNDFFQGFILDQPALGLIASHYYPTRKFFTGYELILIAEGRPLPSESEVNRMVATNSFYSFWEGQPNINIRKKRQSEVFYKDELKTAKAFMTVVKRRLGLEFFSQLEKEKNKMINISDLNLGLTHGETSVGNTSNFSSNREDAFSGPIACKFTYYNHCSFDIVVVDRTGLRHSIQSRAMNFKPSFIIRRNYSITKEAYENLLLFFNATLDDDLVDVMRIFKTQFMEKYRASPMSPSMFITIDTHVSANDIKNNNGAMYVVGEDIVISDKSLLKAPKHPFNTRTINVKDFDEFSNGYGDVGINFELIDNQGGFGDRFIMIAKTVYKISPKRDIVRREGLYVTHMVRDPENDIKKKPIQTFYEFSTIQEKLGIYKTMEEAISGGDIQALRKESIASMEYNNRVEQNKDKERIMILERENRDFVQEISLNDQKRKEDFLSLKHEMEMREIRVREEYNERERLRAEDLARLNLNNKFLEAELERSRNNTKDYYENKNYDRKNTSDIIKWIPVMVTAVLSVITIVVVKTKVA